MNIKKFFEFYSSGIRFIVKKELTEDEREDIVDAFTMYILDNYQSILQSKEDFRKNIFNIDPLNRNIDMGYYMYEYNYENDKVFSIDIKKSALWNTSKFNSDMKLFKDRLKKLGFEVVGHPYMQHRDSRYDNQGRRLKGKGYRVNIYKRMFDKKPRLPK